MAKPVYVSMTGLKLKRPWHIFKFFWFAGPAFSQARRAPGNISVETRTITGIRHTLTVWENKDAAAAYAHSGAHAKAVAVFNDIATGYIHGYETRRVPGWSDIPRMLKENGNDFGSGGY